MRTLPRFLGMLLVLVGSYSCSGGNNEPVSTTSTTTGFVDFDAYDATITVTTYPNGTSTVTVTVEPVPDSTVLTYKDADGNVITTHTSLIGMLETVIPPNAAGHDIDITEGGETGVIGN